MADQPFLTQPRRNGRFAPSDTFERFTSKHVPDGDCWRWVGTTDASSGFPRFWLDGRMDEGHRVSYRFYVGEIPEGKVVRRRCENPGCVNPDHLELADKPRPRQGSGRDYQSVYNDPRWKKARLAALLRDGNRCTVARFFGTACTETLHVHHIVPLEDGGAPFDLENLGTACSRHHPGWEALRREVVRSLSEDMRHAIRCPHRHRSAESRRICEARMARERGVYGQRELVA